MIWLLRYNRFESLSGTLTFWKSGQFISYSFDKWPLKNSRLFSNSKLVDLVLFLGGWTQQSTFEIFYDFSSAKSSIYNQCSDFMCGINDKHQFYWESFLDENQEEDRKTKYSQISHSLNSQLMNLNAPDLSTTVSDTLMDCGAISVLWWHFTRSAGIVGKWIV